MHVAADYGCGGNLGVSGDAQQLRHVFREVSMEQDLYLASVDIDLSVHHCPVFTQGNREITGSRDGSNVCLDVVQGYCKARVFRKCEVRTEVYRDCVDVLFVICHEGVCLDVHVHVFVRPCDVESAEPCRQSVGAIASSHEEIIYAGISGRLMKVVCLEVSVKRKAFHPDVGEQAVLTVGVDNYRIACDADPAEDDVHAFTVVSRLCGCGVDCLGLLALVR